MPPRRSIRIHQPGNATISVANNTFGDAAGNRNTDGAELDNTLTLATNSSVTGALDPNAVNANDTPSDSGAKGDNLTSDPTPTLKGTVPPGSTAKIIINGVEQTVTPDATPVAPATAYAQPFPAWLPSPKIPLDGEVVNAQPPSPISWPTFPLTQPAMDGEQAANVRDMPPWMQHNMGTTDSNRDILSAMQGFSDAQRKFAETVLKSITHTTNELRVIQLRLENINRYFHSDL